MYPQLFDLVGNPAVASDLQFDVMCAFDDAARHATKFFYALQDSVTHAGLFFLITIQPFSFKELARGTVEMRRFAINKVLLFDLLFV